MNKEPIILVGGGGHCKACIDVIEMEGIYNVAGIVDDKSKIGQKLLGYDYIGTDDDLEELIKKYKNALVTVGQIKSAKVRIKLYNILKKYNAILPVIISPLAYVSKSSNIKEGTIVMHNVIVNVDASVGENCILNTNSLIEHETIIGKNCHVSTGAKVNGQVKVGMECFLGSGCVIANNVKITDNVIIPAGTTVFKDVLKQGLYFKKK